MDPNDEVASLLKEHKGVLTRSKKHLIYKFPNGKTFTMASTPSDINAGWSQLRDLKATLGIKDPERGLPGERRGKVSSGRLYEAPRIMASASPVMLEAMRKSGLLEAALQGKIDRLTYELRRSRLANSRKKAKLKQLQDHVCRCWGCWISRKWKELCGPS